MPHQSNAAYKGGNKTLDFFPDIGKTPFSNVSALKGCLH